MKRIICFLFCILLLLTQVTSLNAASSQSKDMKGLIIHGQNFWFIISEPKDWTVNIEDAAVKNLNAYFTINGYTDDNTPGLIYIRVMEKGGLTVEKNLKADMDAFAQRKSAKFNKFKEYNVYLIFVLSAEMKNSKKYIDVFRQLIKSFIWGGDQVNDPANGKMDAP